MSYSERVSAAPEQTPSSRWVGAFANDELKLATLYALFDSEEPLTAKWLKVAVDELQEGVVGLSETLPQQLCMDDVEPIGFARETQVSYLKLGKYPATARAHEITSDGENIGIPIAGSLARWSTENPDYPLRGILGVTSYRRTGVEFDSHSSHRLAVFKKLLAHDRPLAVSDFARDERDFRSASSTIGELASEGFVICESSLRENKRTFEITDPIYRLGERKRPFERLKPEVQVMFQAFKVAHKIRSTWALDEFIQLTGELGADDDMQRKVRSRLQHALAPSTRVFGSNVRDESGPKHGNGDGKARTSVALNPAHGDAVESITGLIDAHLNAGKDIFKSGLNDAFEIFSNPDAVAELIAKSRQESGSANNDVDYLQNITSIISSSPEPLTPAEVHGKYQVEHNRKISLQSILIRLRHLYEDGQLGKIKRQTTLTGKTLPTPAYYSLVETHD